MNFQDFDKSDFQSTYSPEDDKLRIYTDLRFDCEDWDFLMASGFKWAPKQDLIYAYWSPSREDLCINLAGVIEMEGMTLAERAEAKAERLELLSDKREAQAGAFHEAAKQISERFVYGQPILIGHHSERKARKDKDKMESAQRHADDAINAANYWQTRARGVARFANMKNSPRTRINRIKKLLADLRSYQREINAVHKGLALWGELSVLPHSEKRDYNVKMYSGFTGINGVTPSLSGRSIYSQLDDGTMTTEEVIKFCLEYFESSNKSRIVYRKLSHILNRLGYETEMLGDTPLYTESITPAIIKAFARSHGAEKPEVKKVSGGFQLSSQLPLPAHISSDKTILLSPLCWSHLMKDVGYTVPIPAPKKPPILNFKVSTILGTQIVYQQIEMSSAEYKKIHASNRCVRLSACGAFRFKVFMKGYELFAAFITDSKIHPAPDSSSINIGEGV